MRQRTPGPPCPNPACQQPYVARNGHLSGHPQVDAFVKSLTEAHMSATAKESAALAAELARGVSYHGRSRREVPWAGVTTLAPCHARLEERLAGGSLRRG